MKKYVAKGILGFAGLLFCWILAAGVIVMPGMAAAFLAKWSIIGGTAAFALGLAVNWALKTLPI